MAYERKEHAGGAITTTLSGSITSGATSAAIVASTGWPSGSVGPFYAVIDPGLATEEKVLITSRTSLTLNTITRGVDGTSAVAHDSGATIQHVFTAVEADEANLVVNKTVGAVTAKGDLIAATGNQALGKLAVGANDALLTPDSGQTTGLKWVTTIAQSLVTNLVSDLATLTTAVAGKASATLTSAHILVGNGSNVATDVAVTGDVTISNAGVTTLGANKVTTAKILDANVTAAKIAAEAWTTYTVAITANVAVNHTIARSAYFQSGKSVWGDVDITVTADYAGNQPILISLPVTALYNSPQPCGDGFVAMVTLNSGNLTYVGCRLDSTTHLSLFSQLTSGAGSGGRLGVDPNKALSSTDRIRVRFSYEAA